MFKFLKKIVMYYLYITLAIVVLVSITVVGPYGISATEEMGWCTSEDHF